MNRKPHRKPTSGPLALATALFYGACCLMTSANAQNQAAAQSRVDLPIFDLEKASYSLGAQVTEQPFAGDAVYRWRDIAAQLQSGDAKTDLATFVLTYIDLVVSGETQRLPDFLEAGAEGKVEAEQAQLLQFMLGQLGTLDTVQMLKVWYFESYRVVLARITGDAGKSSVYSFSLREVAGGEAGERYVLAGDWGRYQPVQLMFWYAAGNFKDAAMEKHQARAFGQTIEITGDGQLYPLSITFEGQRYKAAEALAEPAADADPSTAAGLVAKALAVAESDDDVQFLELWKGEEKREILALQSKSPALYEGLKDELSASQRIRHVLTADLGEYAVHYFLEDGAEASDLRSVVLRREDGRYWLTRGLYSNVETLFRSELVKEKIQIVSR